ncbi:hypothetical protein LINGRAHAP2_LOCUS11500 [Linum grandiflorum]
MIFSSFASRTRKTITVPLSGDLGKSMITILRFRAGLRNLMKQL